MLNARDKSGPVLNEEESEESEECEDSLLAGVSVPRHIIAFDCVECIVYISSFFFLVHGREGGMDVLMCL
jgi:hypothetical protein